MNEALQSTLQKFKQFIYRMKSYNEAVSLMYWDLRTGAPRKSAEQRSQVIGLLSTEVFKMGISEEMKNYLETLLPHVNELDTISRRMVEEAKKEYDKSSKIPPDRYQQFVILMSQAETAWEDAKGKSDFALVQPYLEKIIEFQKEFIGYLGYEGHPYNTLLDLYEPGMTVEQLDALFAALKEKIVPLVNQIKNSTRKPNTSIVTQSFDIAQQRALSKWILEKIGYDFEAGRLDDTVHPFCIGLNPHDVRVTNRYNYNDLREGIFGAIHEGGHAIYEQNISSDLIGTNLCEGASMGIHESQSRFMENIIGRSKAFWDCYFEGLVQFFPEQLHNVSVEDFYFVVNESQPSFIRTEADELTYNLHIMIRYEIEKGLITGELNVRDLPQIWNEKMKEYLGIVPSNDTEGVLQDMHWFSGNFGYFPSYSLGNMYAAQLEHTLRKEMPDYEEAIRRGEVNKVVEWLHDKVHQYGKLLTPKELIEKATGEPLNGSYLANYLEKKFRDLYQL